MDEEKMRQNKLAFSAYYYFLVRIGAEDVISYREIFRDQTYKWLYERIKPNTLMLDIGGAIGDTATYFAMHPNTKEIWSYEPQKRLYAKMESNLKRANFDKPIKTYNIALERLDEVLKLAKEPVAIKCDIEGGEYQLFNDEVDLSKVYAIMMEYHNHPEPLIKVLSAKGFKVSHKQGHTEMIGYIYASR